MLKKYARLLLDYCLDIQSGEKLYIRTTTEAVPLLKEIYRYGLSKNAIIEYDLSFAEKGKLFFDGADGEQLKHEPILQKHAIEYFDAYLVIKAPANIMELNGVDQEKKKLRSQALKDINQTYFRRTAEGTLKRNLCLYPTQASAQLAGMDLESYSDFVYSACRLDEAEPVTAWLEVRKKQQKLVDFLNKSKMVRYQNARMDVQFSIEGRTWINSDGRTNMPSGEVFTGPVEESVEGTVFFDYPSIYMGQEVQGIELKIEQGKIVRWSAEQGGSLLDQVFAIPGSQYFGEVAIGTNYRIQRPTKNILFDEKIGGSIHMAVGQSYKQTGGKNQSAIHWDLIADMRNGGKIMVDGDKIYENGQFLSEIFEQ